VTSVIVGAKRPEQLADNLAATDIDLTGEELAALDAVSKPASEYPGWMLERQGQGQRDLLAERR
jgi:diketogulonate reductase-like aldo/keto reductase